MTQVKHETDDGGLPDLPLLARSASLSQQAYVALRRALRERKLVPGRIYSEVQLAALLDVSRTPVREALIELAREGVIEKVSQRGVRLRIPTLHELREAFDLREVVEAYVVARLAEEATEEDIRSLYRILERQEDAKSDRASFLEVDEEFHAAMAQRLGLERSREMLVTLRAIVSISGVAALEAAGRTTAVVLQEHRAVVDGLARGNREASTMAIVAHIRNTARAAEANLRAGEEPHPRQADAGRSVSWRLE